MSRTRVDSAILSLFASRLFLVAKRHFVGVNQCLSRSARRVFLQSPVYIPSEKHRFHFLHRHLSLDSVHVHAFRESPYASFSRFSQERFGRFLELRSSRSQVHEHSEDFYISLGLVGRSRFEQRATEVLATTTAVLLLSRCCCRRRRRWWWYHHPVVVKRKTTTTKVETKHNPKLLRVPHTTTMMIHSLVCVVFLFPQ